MQTPSRMPRYDVRNDGIGPYAVFYCDRCEREFRSQPDVTANLTKDIGRQAAGGLLRNVPVFGRSLAYNVSRDNTRYNYSLTPDQVEAAWKQVQGNFRECPTCLLVVCLSDFDTQSGYCKEDSPRREEIAEAQTEQAAGVLKGLANAFGLGEAVRGATEAAKAAQKQSARCPNDGTLAAAGTKFCPECGSPMVQPAADACPQCSAQVGPAAKFCPECGGKIERAAPMPAMCGACGAEVKSGKFCPECGTKVG